MKTFLSLILLVVLLPFTLLAQDVDEKLSSLQKVGEGFAVASAMSSSSGPMLALSGEYRDFSNNFSSLQSYVQNGNYDQAIRILRRWLARTKNDQIKAGLTDLLAAMEKEKDAQDAKTAEQMNAIIKKVSAQLAAAKTPEDVAKAQIQLEEFRDFDLNNSDNRSNRVFQTRINRMINTIDYWRQVLDAEQMGDFSSALQNLNNLRRNASSSSLLDAAVITNKYTNLLEALTQDNAQKPISPINKVISQAMEKVKAPSDAAAASATMSELTSFTSGRENRLTYALQNSLNELARMNDDFESGAFARVINQYSGHSTSTPYTRQIEKLKESLRIKAVAAVNDLPDLGSPKEGEAFSSFIRRLAVEAFEKKDWQKLYTLLSVYSSVTGGGCARTTNMKEGVASFLAAQQLEQAGQFGDAVANYSASIAHLGKLVPREEATAALARLRKDHPEAFNPTGNLKNLK